MRLGNGTAVVVCAFMMALAACSSGGSSAKPAVKAAAKPGTPSGPEIVTALPVAAGTALPPGYKIDAGRTLIFGTDENWTGRLSYTTPTPADDVFDFLHREMPSFGWTETTAMRSDVSLISFLSTASGRAATIHIERGGTLGGGTRVDMVVSPVSTAKGPARAQSVTPAR